MSHFAPHFEKGEKPTFSRKEDADDGCSSINRICLTFPTTLLPKLPGSSEYFFVDDDGKMGAKQA